MTRSDQRWTPLTPASLPRIELAGADAERRTSELARQWHVKFLQSVNLEEFIRMDPAIRRVQIENKLHELMRDSAQQLSYGQTSEIVTFILNEALGYGPLSNLVNDPSVTEIMVNGPSTVYVERAGTISKSDVRFQDEEHLRNMIDRIVSRVGRRVDEASPMVDARLPDGSRVNAMIPPLSLDGPILTVRKFQSDPLNLEDLVRFGSLTEEMELFLEACVRARMSIVVSGGTGTGKTTLLNALASFISPSERVITVEDSAELKFHQQHPHVVRTETRPPNMQGAGAVSIRDLVRNSLRMRPDRIVVGEVRGAETLDMLQAMNTGHEGSMTTVHANTPRDAVRRLETMVMWAEGASSLPVTAIREQIASAIDIIVQVTRYPNGRKVSAISEVQEMRHGDILLTDIFRFDVLSTEPSTGHVTGRHDATGVEPRCFAQIGTSGIQSITKEIFIPHHFEEMFGDLLQDKSITEIMINALDDVRIEQRGRGIRHTNLYFESNAHLLSMINSIIAPLGKQLNARNPLVDARLPQDGSRINVAIPPVVPDGPVLTIRRFPDEPLEMDDLVESGSLTEEMRRFLRACVRGKMNILISGGTGSGKTTLLNALSGFIGQESEFLAGDATDERIITVEDVAELQLQHTHWIRMEAHAADEYGEGQVTIRDLVINALRMRPDRIIVGEVRGAEALDMLQAMNTGHEGSMTTIHANTPDDAFYRLETMVAWASGELPAHAIRAQIVGALDIIVQTSRLPDGRRRITHIAEVIKENREMLASREIYRYYRETADGRSDLHVLENANPKCMERLRERGVVVTLENGGE